MTETREEYIVSKEETAGAIKQSYECHVSVMGRETSHGPYYHIQIEATSRINENTLNKLRMLAKDAAHALGKDITFKIEIK